MLQPTQRALGPVEYCTIMTAPSPYDLEEAKMEGTRSEHGCLTSADAIPTSSPDIQHEGSPCESDLTPSSFRAPVLDIARPQFPDLAKKENFHEPYFPAACYWTLNNLWFWSFPLSPIAMAGNRPWGRSQDQPIHSDYWKLGQQLLPTTSNAYVQDQFLLHPSHVSFNASQSFSGPTCAPAEVHRFDDDGLDDFDRHLLGMSELPAAHPRSARRLTLPQPQTTMRPVLQLENHPGRSSYSSSMFIPEHHRPGPGYSFLPHRPDLSSATAAHANREPIHRLRELHPGLHQGTSPLHTATYTFSRVEDPVTPPAVRSSSDYGSLSPSAEASIRKQSRTQSLSQRAAPPMSSQEQPPPTVARPDLPREPPLVNGIRLVSIRQSLPGNSFYRCIFPYDLFNAVQSKCFDSAYGSTDNLVVCAPTGSGKTVILELAICKIVADRGAENFKVVYQAPTKALCAERAKDWATKFRPLNLRCAELTGDTSPAEMRRVGSASIIVTTPEKWDSITRKWHDHRKLLQLVELFLIDEVHIVKDVRGATLEAVVSRMKSIGTNVRFVALSATIPNSDDIATWLGRNHQNQDLPALCETFGEEFRPVKLERHVFGYEKRMNDHAFDKYLDSKLPPLLAKYTSGKPILIFCFTRKSCQNTAAMLAELWRSSADEKPWPTPPSPARVLSRELQGLVGAGVAFHHAGLDAGDRISIENAFRDGNLSVICCTSTLAVGVNLPCHTVVLKGTVTYQNDTIHELSDLEVMQMLGRAGRPQFDDSANALILTSSDQKQRYEMMVSGKEVLESTLHRNLIEHLNSEVGLRNVTDLDSANKWLSGTFLSVRLRRNPDYYRLAEDTTRTAQDIGSMVQEICERAIKRLQASNLITRGQVFKQTEYGSTMAKYMVEFETIKSLLELPRAVKMEQLLNTLCHATEFREYRFKPADGPILREVNKSPFILYPIDETVATTWHKISLIVQLHLGGAEYPDSSDSQKQRRQLQQDKKGIFERLQRLVRCVAECKGYECDSISTKTALELVRSLAAEAWEGRPSELLQISQIGPVSMRKLIGQGVKTVKDLVEKNHGELEHMLGRNPPFGKTMSDLLKTFPLLSLTLAIPSRKNMSDSGGGISVPVVATLRYLNQTGLPNWKNRVPSATFLAETTSGLLVYFWKGSLSKIKNDTGLELRFSAEIKAVHEQIRCYFSCEEIVGTIVTKSLDHNIPTSAFKQHSQLIEAASASRPPGYESEDVTNHGCKAPRLQDCTTASSHLHALGEAPSSKSLGSSLSQGDSDDADAVEAAAALLGNMDKPSSSKAEGKNSQSQKTVESDYTDGDFPMIEDILEVMSPQLPRLPQSQTKTNVTARVSAKSVPKDEPVVEKDPVKLPNGKYQCNHACTGGAPTKAGKPCTHRCCQEGLDKPRKLTKKRKADDFSNRESKQSSAITSSAVSSKTSGTKSKKPRTSQSCIYDLNSPNIPRQRSLQQIKCASPSGQDDALMDDFKIECIDLSNVNAKNGDDLPDLESLITYKTMDEAYGADNTKVDGISNSGAGGRQASPLFGSALPSTKDYMKSVPPVITTDYSEMDDDFDEDDLTMFDRDSDESLTVEPAQMSSHELLHHGKAFRSGAEDAMLFSGIEHFMPLRKDAEMNNQLGALSPPSYNKALREASKLCDIDSQSSSFFNKAETKSPEDMDLFDSAQGSSTDTRSPTRDNLTPHSRSTTLDGPTGHGPDSSINVTVPSVVAPAKLETEPDWVQEFDPEFIDSFRGYVNFV